MVSIKIKRGRWSEAEPAKLMLYEKCSNKRCNNGELHYPFSMKAPHCPDCKTNLIGLRLEENIESRISYYLGARL